jgi:hypothetical protein
VKIEMELKKKMNEMKNQMDGKGGLHQEYQTIIKTYKKNEE